MKQAFPSILLSGIAAPAFAGFNEGDGFGPSGLEVLVIAAFGLIALPIGATITFFGLDRLFRVLAWLLAGLVLVTVIAGIALAGQLALVLVVMMAAFAIPSCAVFYLGGLMGRALRRKKQEVQT